MVSPCHGAFYCGDTNGISYGKDCAVQNCILLHDDHFRQRNTNSNTGSDSEYCHDSEYSHSDNSMYSISRRAQPLNKVELNKYIYTHPSCIPLFEHLYCDEQKTQGYRHCWCPCSKTMSGWWRNIGLDFMHLVQYEFNLGVTRGNIHLHLKYKNNCIQHELVHCFLKSYQCYFKGRKSEYFKQLECYLRLCMVTAVVTKLMTT